MENALGNNFLRIEHVGSTAVPNLAAKSIIDIDIVYDLSMKFEDIIKILEKIGYAHIGNLGIVDRAVFVRENGYHPILDKIVHHLYVCRIDSLELERHILFRDFIIQNENARKQYEQLKYTIAEATNQDKKAYATMKEKVASKFIESIILKAKSEQNLQ